MFGFNITTIAFGERLLLVSGQHWRLVRRTVIRPYREQPPLKRQRDKLNDARSLISHLSNIRYDSLARNLAEWMAIETALCSSYVHIGT